MNAKTIPSPNASTPWKRMRSPAAAETVSGSTRPRPRPLGAGRAVATRMRRPRSASAGRHRNAGSDRGRTPLRPAAMSWESPDTGAGAGQDGHRGPVLACRSEVELGGQPDEEARRRHTVSVVRPRTTEGCPRRVPRARRRSRPRPPRHVVSRAADLSLVAWFRGLSPDCTAVTAGITRRGRGGSRRRGSTRLVAEGRAQARDPGRRRAPQRRPGVVVEGHVDVVAADDVHGGVRAERTPPRRLQALLAAP